MVFLRSRAPIGGEAYSRAASDARGLSGMSTNAETAGSGSEVKQHRRVVDDGRAARGFGWRPEVPIARRLTRRWFRARGLILLCHSPPPARAAPWSSRKRPSP